MDYHNISAIKKVTPLYLAHHSMHKLLSFHSTYIRYYVIALAVIPIDLEASLYMRGNTYVNVCTTAIEIYC